METTLCARREFVNRIPTRLYMALQRSREWPYSRAIPTAVWRSAVAVIRTRYMIRECVEVGAGPARLATSRALRSAGVARTVGRADVAGVPIRPNLVEGKFLKARIRAST